MEEQICIEKLLSERLVGSVMGFQVKILGNGGELNVLQKCFTRIAGWVPSNLKWSPK